MSPSSGGRARPLRIAGIASHRGTNLRHIDDVCHSGSVDAELVLLISNNGASGILSYAKSRPIASRHLSGKTHPDSTALDAAILSVLQQFDVDIVVLSGYMKRLGPATVEAFHNRVLNIHPALLPSYGGRGMYGDRVYEAVLAAREEVTGATLHIVDEEYDHGPTVAQETVAVKAGDTIEQLRNRVMQCERRLILDSIARLARGDLDLDQIAERASVERALVGMAP